MADFCIKLLSKHPCYIMADIQEYHSCYTVAEFTVSNQISIWPINIYDPSTMYI